MRYLNFNGEKISKLSLGTVQFGLNYGIANQSGKPSQKDVNEIIDYLYKNGLNCFDTAQAYGNSEEVIGKALNKKENIYPISKLKSDLFVNNAIDNIEQSLKNLQVDSLYALLLHDSTLLYDWKQEYSQLIERLIECKKIKYFGVSIYTSEDFMFALENEKIKFIQIPFNLFDQRALNENWFELAKKHNKLIFIRSIFLQGLLLMDKENVPTKLEKAKLYIDKLDSYCLENNMTKNELALSFVDSVAQESLLLFGCDNLTQANENLNNYNNLKKLTQADISSLCNLFKDVDEIIYNPTKW
jgi:aryl-alcohol dehydrogenase-like predicted oxidoreductase